MPDSLSSVSVSSAAGSSIGNSIAKLRFDDRSRTRISLALQNSPTRASPTPNNSSTTISSAAGNGAPAASVSDSDTKTLYNHSDDATKSVVKWSRIDNLSNLLSSVPFLHKFGAPILLEISSVYMAIATDKGFIIGFNYRQGIEFVLRGRQDGEDDSTTDLTQSRPPTKDGIITCMAFSSDSTNLAAGNSNGEITIWHLSGASTPGNSNAGGSATTVPTDSAFLKPAHVIHGITREDEIRLSKEGHLENTPINNVGFINAHHSQLYSSDITGTVCYHLGIKQVLKRRFVSKRILGNDTGNLTIKACEILPLGTSEQITDHLGVLAVMTNKVLVIVSILSLNHPHSTKIMTHFSVNTTKNKQTANTLDGCLSWFPCMAKSDTSDASKKSSGASIENAKLAYSSDKVLTVLEVENDSMPKNLLKVIADLKDKDKAIPTLSIQKTSKWKCNKPILAIKWISSNILCVFTKDSVWTLHYARHGSKREKSLSVIGEDLTTTDNNSNTAIQVFKDMLMILGHSNRANGLASGDGGASSSSTSSTPGASCEVVLGSLINWAHILMGFLSTNEHLKALITASHFYTMDLNKSGSDSYLISVGLPLNTEKRKSMVKPYLIDIMRTSIPFLFKIDNGGSEGEEPELSTNLKIYLDIISDIDGSGSFTDILESVFEEVTSSIFFETLEPYLLNRSITALSPVVLKALVLYYVKNENASEREVETYNEDITLKGGDILTEILCLLDITSLDIDLTIQLCRQYDLRDALVYVWNYLLHDYETPLLDFLDEIKRDNSSSKSSDIFTYMSYILTGRQYPTDRFIDSSTESIARETITKHLFKANENGSVFPNLVTLLRFNSFQMLSTLNEFFEDTSLNDTQGKVLNRQYIVEALLDVYDAYDEDFDSTDRCQLSIFIGRNYPKYPQFIRLSESTIESVINTLCNNDNDSILLDCELALQSLIGEYDPEFDTILIEKLKAAKFYDVLIGVYRAQGKYSKVLETWIQRQSDTAIVGGTSNVYDSLTKVLDDSFLGTDRSSGDSSNINRFELTRVIKDNFKVLIEEDIVALAREIEKYDKSLHEYVLNLEGDEKGETIIKYVGTLTQYVKVEKIDFKLIYTYIEKLLERDPDSSFVSEFLSKNMSFIVKWSQKFEELFLKFDGIENLTVIKIASSHFQTALAGLLKYMREHREKVNGNVDLLERLLNIAIESCVKYEHEIETNSAVESEATFDGELYLNERMWLSVINFCVLEMSRKESTEDIYSRILQECFKQISSSGSSNKIMSGRKERSLLAIFNKFLENDSGALSSTEEGEGAEAGAGSLAHAVNLSSIRGILQEVFISYAYENEMLNICLRSLHSGINKSMKIIRAKNLSGISITGKFCASCGKIMWGDEDQISEDHWLAWEDLQQQSIHLSLRTDTGEKYKHCGLIFFACGHGYHKTCWEGIGGGSCAICTSTRT